MALTRGLCFRKVNSPNGYPQTGFYSTSEGFVERVKESGKGLLKGLKNQGRVWLFMIERLRWIFCLILFYLRF